MLVGGGHEALSEGGQGGDAPGFRLGVRRAELDRAEPRVRAGVPPAQ